MDKKIGKAIDILKAGGVVAIPTETVYGLAASIRSPEGINKIFETKERPFFDPLIVHVATLDQAKSCVKGWNKICDEFAEAFWPGPLTMILPKEEHIDDKITSGLDTVGIRFPSHVTTIELIKRLGCPIAAPSANKFKKLSPTTAQHVLDEFPDLMVLDGGECEVGIESTIIGITDHNVTIYRPGMITKEMIQDKIPSTIEIEYQESPVAPGHLKHHYQPNKPLILRIEKDKLQHEFKKTNKWKIDEQPIQVARILYAKIRELDREPGEAIEIIIPEKMVNDEAYFGILNRLIKASYLKSERINPEY